VLSIEFGPSSKDKKISPEERPAASIDSQIVHRARRLWMKEFRSSGVENSKKKAYFILWYDRGPALSIWGS
jgi:hypothetical protein